MFLYKIIEQKKALQEEPFYPTRIVLIGIGIFYVRIPECVKKVATLFEMLSILRFNIMLMSSFVKEMNNVRFLVTKIFLFD